MSLIVGIICYLAIGLFFAGVCSLHDHINIKSGHVDTKFPNESYNRKMYISLSPFWLPIAFIIVIGYCKNKF